MTTPPFNPQVPLVSDFIADSQSAFLTNFNTINSSFRTNHVFLSAPTNAGNHNVIQLTEQAEEGRSTESQEIALYTKKVKNQTTQLFMRYPLDGKEFQLNEYQIYQVNHIPNVQGAYFSMLPGGIIVYFGYITGPTTFFTNFEITLDPVICSNIMGINICPLGTVPSFQARVVGLQQSEGKYSKVILASSDGNIPASHYYVIYGNIL